MKKELPKEFIISNPYDIPIHDQGIKNNCTSHSIASMFEYQLSTALKEQVIIDVDDLWEKQLKYGTAKEDQGDYIEGALKIAFEYGLKFKTKSGRSGIFKPTEGIEFF